MFGFSVCSVNTSVVLIICLHLAFNITFICDKARCWTCFYLFVSEAPRFQQSTYQSPLGFDVSVGSRDGDGPSNVYRFQ